MEDEEDMETEEDGVLEVDLPPGHGDEDEGKEVEVEEDSRDEVGYRHGAPKILERLAVRKSRSIGWNSWSGRSLCHNFFKSNTSMLPSGH